MDTTTTTNSSISSSQSSIVHRNRLKNSTFTRKERSISIRDNTFTTIQKNKTKGKNKYPL